MATSAPESPKSRGLIATRIVLAALIGLAILAINLPSIRLADPAHGAGVVERAAILWTLIVRVPVAIVAVGSIRARGMELFGWALLVVMLALRIST